MIGQVCLNNIFKVRIKVVIKRRFKLLKAYLYLGVYLNFTFFFIRLINS